MIIPTILLTALLVPGVLTPAAPIPTRQGLAEAERRIERIRKSDCVIVVHDAKGRPVRDADIDVVQTSHSFLFGCAAISLLKHADAEQEALYQKRFREVFNFATVLTYWQDTEPKQGQPTLDRLTGQARRLKEMGIRVKGHPLILAGASPSWAPTDPDAARDVTKRRIADMVTRFKNEIDIWDVVGDATTAANAKNGLGAWARKAGAGRFTADALTWAHAANPSATLLYNDYKLDTDYTDLVQYLKKSRAPLDVLGLEAHMIGSEWPMEKVWETAETFARLNIPLHFSEITVLSDDPKANHRVSWPTTPEGEQRQADYVEKLYTLLFSHPAVEGIAWWNFVDGDWDRNPGGLLRSALTPKPAYDRLVNLIRHKWNTSAHLSTGRDGSAAFRGFAGKYQITVRSRGLTTATEAQISRGRKNRILIRI